MASIDVDGTAVLPAGDALGDACGRVVTRLGGLEVQR